MHLSDRSKFGANLNPFKINLIRFENRIGRTVLPTLPVSAASTASPRRTQPLTIRPHRTPAHLSAASTASRRPRRPPLSCGTAHVDDHRSNPATAERHRPTPFAPPHRRPAVLVRPCPLLLAQHLPRDPLEISGNTLPPLSHRRAVGEHATAPSQARSARGDRAGTRRPVAPLGRAARPWPRRRFDRPRVAGHRVPWALASGRFWPGTVPMILNIFPIVLNRRN
jgi:hypothetical protein